MLDGVSFTVGQGEFFGVAGPNGSGKSTLLKIIAGIYRSDSGTVSVAGLLSPFLEMGVGFNDELTARENIVLNGTMLGLTPRQIRERRDEIIAFADLDEFADLQLKNFSSGMRVRLAFALAMQVDADILLLDEVLAVGDDAFKEKCFEEFRHFKQLRPHGCFRHPQHGDDDRVPRTGAAARRRQGDEDRRPGIDCRGLPGAERPPRQGARRGR